MKILWNRFESRTSVPVSYMHHAHKEDAGQISNKEGIMWEVAAKITEKGLCQKWLWITFSLDRIYIFCGTHLQLYVTFNDGSQSMESVDFQQLEGENVTTKIALFLYIFEQQMDKLWCIRTRCNMSCLYSPWAIHLIFVCCKSFSCCKVLQHKLCWYGNLQFNVHTTQCLICPNII